MSAQLQFVRYGVSTPGVGLLRFVPGPVREVEALDEAFAAAFRAGRLPESPLAEVVMERAQAALREVGRAVLGDELLSDVGCWLGDGPCEDGSVLEALSALHDEGVLNLGVALRRQCTAAGFPPARVGAQGPSWAQRVAEGR